jgi:polar amino acid transport system substrate-binding protein
MALSFAGVRKLAFVLVLLVALTGLIAAACDDDDDNGNGDGTPVAGETPQTGTIDISGVPELENGELHFGSDIAYPPMEFLDEETDEPDGFDIDLGRAIAERLGVQARFTNSSFDGLIPALQTERFDAILSAMTATESRAEQVDFIEYFNAGSGIVVPAGNPDGIEGPEDLCGKTVAVQEGTIQVEFLEERDQECRDNGEDGIEIRRFSTDPEAVQALLAGQADAEMADFPVAAYSAQQTGERIEVIPNQIDPAPYGIAVRNDSPLRDVIQQALDELRADGTYDQLLEKWNLEAGRLD